MNQDARTTIALVAASFVAGLCFVLPLVLRGGNNLTPTTLALFALMFVYATFISSIAAATAGLAWHAWATRQGWKHWAGYVVAGAVIGAAFGLATTILLGALPSSPLVAESAGIGAASALFFWLIRRPDRDAANPTTSPS